jgi:hypothetical protein
VRPRCPMRCIRTWEAHEAFKEQPWLVLLLARILKAASAVLVACAVLHTLTACGTAAEEAGGRRGGDMRRGFGWSQRDRVGGVLSRLSGFEHSRSTFGISFWVQGRAQGTACHDWFPS